MYNNGQFVIHNNDLAIIIAEQKNFNWICIYDHTKY